MTRVKITETTSGNSYTEEFTTRKQALDFARFVNSHGWSTANGAIIEAEILEN